MYSLTILLCLSPSFGKSLTVVINRFGISRLYISPLTRPVRTLSSLNGSILMESGANDSLR